MFNMGLFQTSWKSTGAFHFPSPLEQVLLTTAPCWAPLGAGAVPGGRQRDRRQQSQAGGHQKQKNPGQVLASQACFPGSRMSPGLHSEGFCGCHPTRPRGLSPLASASRREPRSPAASAAAPHRRSSPCPAWSAWPSSTASGQSSGSWDIL